MIDLRENTIRQTSHDVIHQWRTERGPEKITGIIRTSKKVLRHYQME